MANGTYGTRKPADITSNDVDIYYHYRPTRNSDAEGFSEFRKLDSSILGTTNATDEEGNSFVLSGLYDLRLPLEQFGSDGIYTIYIKPKEIRTKIIDVSTLAAYPNIRGIVIDTTELDGSLKNNGNLVGYRIEYYEGGTKRSDYRIITSNNKCEPVAQNLNDSSQKGIRYRYNDSSNLMFCTVTPSTSLSFKSSSTPYIGEAMGEIALINTKFNPIMLEVEMTKHDIETISTMLEGNQIRNKDNALITTFSPDGGIYHQAAYGAITNPEQGINHDFKYNNERTVDFNEIDKFNTIRENI